MDADALNRLLDRLIGLSDSRLEALTPAAVAPFSGSDAETLRRHWADAEALAVALHARHLETLAGLIATAIDGMQPGRSRLQVAVEHFWDVCLTRVPIRRLIRGARRDPDIDDDLERRNRGFVHLLFSELSAMGMPNARAAAALLRVTVQAVAAEELQAGQARPDLRAALWQLMVPTPA
ncbi:MAG TPA: hypothetical protein VGE57_06715 [Solimonas sp.]